MNKVLKVFRGVVKSFDEKTHRATIFISTGDIDRDQEVIEPKAFQKRLGNYMAHPVLLSSHRADQLTRQIGEAHALKITDDGVEGEYEWYVGKGNQEADWGWFLVTRGIAAFSVGFMAHGWIDKFTQPALSSEDAARGIQRRFTDIELLENSQVLVPANPNALQRRITEAQGEEKELCELVVKEVKAEDMVRFDVAPAPKTDPQAEALEKRIQAVVEKMRGDQQVLVLFEKILTPKHYSQVLLGAGDIDPVQSPTKEKPVDKAGAMGKTKTLTTKDILGAIHKGAEEGMQK